MNKLPLIIKREYLAKVRNKSFVIMTFLSPILMVAMVVLIAYLTKLNDSDKRVIGLLNESDYFAHEFLMAEDLSYVNFSDVSLQTAKDSTAKNDYYALLYIPSGKNLEEVAENSFLYTKDAPNTAVLDKLDAIFQQRLRQERLQEIGVSTAEFEAIDKPFEINTATFAGDLNLKGITEIKAFIGGAFGYLIMMFIIIYGGFVMRSVIEEKTSRIIEVIISSVKPFELMLGKIIGTSLAGITQFAIWIVSGGGVIDLGLCHLRHRSLCHGQRCRGRYQSGTAGTDHRSDLTIIRAGAFQDSMGYVDRIFLDLFHLGVFDLQLDLRGYRRGS